MDYQETTQTRPYPLDLAQMQALVRQVIAADPAYSDLWEPAYGGMISVRAGRFATPLEVSWKQIDGATDLTATILAPLTGRGRADYFGIRQRELERFFAALDRAAQAAGNPANQPEPERAPCSAHAAWRVTQEGDGIVPSPSCVHIFS